jgi:hypothetical protein
MFVVFFAFWRQQFNKCTHNETTSHGGLFRRLEYLPHPLAIIFLRYREQFSRLPIMFPS